MIFYKDKNNNLHVLESAKFEYLLPSDCIKITDAEADEIRRKSNKKTIDELKSSALTSIDNYHALQVQALVGNPTQVEKDTWALKLEAANAIINNAELTIASNAFLTSAGLDSDTDRFNWANSVIAKSVHYSTFVGVAERLRNNARTAIKSATTEEELNATLEEHRKISEDAVAELGGS